MEIIIESKAFGGASITVDRENLTYKLAMQKQVIPVKQIASITYKNWRFDPYVTIETTGGQKIKMVVNVKDKQKIEEAVSQAKQGSET